MTSSSSRSTSPSILRLAVTTAVGLFFALIMIATAKTGPTHSKVVVCYIATWAVYRPGKGSYSIENFDPSLCTHVVYAFAGLNATTHDSIVSLDPWQDLKDNYGKNGFERITNLRRTHPHLKVSLAIGGWNEGSANYSMMAADANKRTRFVKQVTSFIRFHKFDGLDLDWEYPTQRGGKSYDRENFVSLTKELRQEFDKHGLILTSAIGAAKHVMDEAYDFKSLTKYLDFLHIMCYDYGGSWDRKVGANAPLTGDGPLNIKFTIDYIIKSGAMPSKIVLGVPFYGRTFVTNNEGNLGDVSDDQGFKGPFTRENGFLGYNEICAELSNKSTGWTRTFDEDTNQAIIRLRDEAKQETKVVTYDDSRAMANKMRFAVEKSLGGIMVWSIDTDDFLGECQVDSSLTETFVDFGKTPGVQLSIPKRISGNYPLLRTINEGLILAEDEIDQEYQIKRKQQEEDRENEIPHGEDNIINNSAPSILTNAWILVLVCLYRLF